MDNINELENLGYILENVENRLFRVENSYGDTIATIHINSGFIQLEKGQIFNYLTEVKTGIKKVGTNKFFNL